MPDPRHLRLAGFLCLLAACDAGDSGAAAEPECTPVKVPECINEGDPISCDVAVWTWFGGEARGEKSPRAICEKECPGGVGDGLAAGGCVDVRRHRRVENDCYGTLDVESKEDAGHWTRKGNGLLVCSLVAPRLPARAEVWVVSQFGG